MHWTPACLDNPIVFGPFSSFQVPHKRHDGLRGNDVLQIVELLWIKTFIRSATENGNASLPQPLIHNKKRVAAALRSDAESGLANGLRLAVGVALLQRHQRRFDLRREKLQD